MQTNRAANSQAGKARPAGGKVATLRLWLGLLRGVRRQPWGLKMGYLFVLPGLLLFLTFQVWPIFRGLWMAFTDYRFLIPGYQPFVGVGNFVEAFTDDKYFWPSFRRSLYFTAVYMPPQVLLGLVMASIIGTVRNKAISAFYRTIVYLPVVLPIAVSVMMWRQFYNNQYGFVNYFFRSWLHAPRLAQRWLIDPRWVIPAVAISRIWKDCGLTTMLFLIGMYGINKELYEAAAIDGANAWRQWKDITLPLLKPILILVLVLNANVASAAQSFMIMFGQHFGPENSAMTLGFYIWKLAFRWGDLRLGYAASMSLFLGVISLVASGLVFISLKAERA